MPKADKLKTYQVHLVVTVKSPLNFDEITKEIQENMTGYNELQVQGYELKIEELDYPEIDLNI